jgi:GNAT superfamily N-acetyltransferase
MSLNVGAVKSPRELNEFIQFPMALYRRDPLFVPPLLTERREFFSQKKNPIFQFTEVAYFLARQNGKLAGRVTAHINRQHNEFHQEKTGFFGFFECIEDLAVARALMQAAEDWLRQRQVETIRGPFNFSTNEECGFLAQGFELPPVFMMPYNRPFYLAFMEQLGYAKAKDLYAYDYAGDCIPDYLVKLAARIREKSRIRVRPLNMRRFEHEVKTIFDVYNAAWQKNWGFVPATADEFRYTAKSLKSIIEPELALIAEEDGKAIAFSLALPDYNVVLKKMKGRMLPIGFLHFLLGKRKIDRVRVLTMGVIGEYRKRGIDLLLYHDTFANGLRLGYNKCEMSWMLEDNYLINRAMERMGAKIYKIYRIYEKPV